MKQPESKTTTPEFPSEAFEQFMKDIGMLADAVARNNSYFSGNWNDEHYHAINRLKELKDE